MSAPRPRSALSASLGAGGGGGAGTEGSRSAHPPSSIPTSLLEEHGASEIQYPSSATPSRSILAASPHSGTYGDGVGVAGSGARGGGGALHAHQQQQRGANYASSLGTSFTAGHSFGMLSSFDRRRAPSLQIPSGERRGVQGWGWCIAAAGRQ